jgi:hypothetical protein
MDRRWATSRYSFVAYILGLTLIAASLLKFYAQISTPPPPRAGDGVDLLESRWLIFGVSACEISVGLWLAVGLYPRLSRWAAVACFLAFLGVSLGKALAGEADCGCFGPLPVNPWITFGFDCAALAALLCSRPQERGYESPRFCLALRITPALSALGVLLAGVVLLAHMRPVRWDQRDSSWSARPLVSLDPDEWTDGPLPILEQIDVGSKLRSGDWVLVFYRRGCESCRSELPKLLNDLSHEGKTADGSHIAAIEVPSDGGDDPLSRVKPGCVAARGTLSSGPRWVVRTPLFLRLKAGVVQDYAYSAREAARMFPLAGQSLRSEALTGEGRRS